MSEAFTVFAVIGPLATIAIGAWRISAIMAKVEYRLREIERENRQLRSDVLALQTLLRLLVDRARVD
jgi:hypothetical protein